MRKQKSKVADSIKHSANKLFEMESDRSAQKMREQIEAEKDNRARQKLINDHYVKPITVPIIGQKKIIYSSRIEDAMLVVCFSCGLVSFGVALAGFLR
jgi:hypothetical protein